MFSFFNRIIILLFASKICHSCKISAPDIPSYCTPQITYTNDHAKENVGMFILRLLSMNLLFDFMYHYDNVGRDFVENAFRNYQVSKSKTEMFVRRICYYENQTEPFFKTRAVNGYNMVHFIFLKEVSRFEELNGHYLMIHDRAAIICIRNAGLCVDQFNSSIFNFEVIAKAEYLKTVYSVLVFEISDNELKLYEMCYYCGSYSLKPKLLLAGQLSGDITFFLKRFIDVFLEKSRNSFTNLNGHNFRVGIPLKDIFFNCEVQNATRIADYKIVECSKLSGQEAEMLKILSVNMNFTLTMVYFDEFKSVFESLSSGSLDWAVGSITMTPERWKISLFSFPIQEDPLKVVYSVKRSSYIVQVLQLLRVFPLRIWLLLAVAILMQSFTIYLVNRFYKGPNERIPICVRESDFVLDTISKSKDKSLQKLSKVLSIEKGVCATLKKLTQDKYFLINEKYTLKYAINEQCKDELSKEDILSLKFSQDEIFISLHAWPLRFDSPYIHQLNLKLLHLSECGLDAKLAEDILDPQYKQLVYFDGNQIVDGEENKGKTELNKLQVAQNKGMRAVLGCSRYTRVKDMMDKLKYLSVNKMLYLNVLCLVFKIKNKMVPRYLLKNVKYNFEIHEYPTRGRDMFRIGVPRRASTESSLFYKGFRLFNELPPHVRCAPSMPIFRGRCIKYLLENNVGSR